MPMTDAPLKLNPSESPESVESIARAVDVLRSGGLVALPTETVYGLGADASNPEAVRKIFQVKGRPANHPVIVHIAGSDQLTRWAKAIPESAYRLAEAFWPGPLTMILNKADAVIPDVTGGQDTVGLRVPSHPLTLAVLKAFDGGVAAPSANRFGRISPTTAQHVRDDLGEDVDLILDGGPCDVGVESTIIDLTGPQPRVLRPGQIAIEALESVLVQPVLLPNSHQKAPRAPGMLKSHYAPITPVCLADTEALWHNVPSTGVALTVSALAQVMDIPPGWVTMAMPGDPSAYARCLYARLRDADALGLEQIRIEKPLINDAWMAIHDRLSRAAVPPSASQSDSQREGEHP